VADYVRRRAKGPKPLFAPVLVTVTTDFFADSLGGV
jgi:hypothetical protein